MGAGIQIALGSRPGGVTHPVRNREQALTTQPLLSKTKMNRLQPRRQHADHMQAILDDV